jgi:hypothetical protein
MRNLPCFSHQTSPEGYTTGAQRSRGFIFSPPGTIISQEDPEEVVRMDMVSALQAQREAVTGVQIQYATANKVLKATEALQVDMLNKLLGSMGIGNNLNVEA